MAKTNKKTTSAIINDDSNDFDEVLNNMSKSSNTNAKTETPKTPAPAATVAVPFSELAELLNSVKTLTAEVAALKSAKPKTEKELAAEKAATAAEKKASAKEKRKETWKKIAETALASAKEATGKSEEEIKAAFAEARRYGAEDQDNYKKRYNEKLFSLIGWKRYANESK